MNTPGSQSYVSNSNVSGGSEAKEYKNWRKRSCWHFNKVKGCTKQGCNFDHRCNYCGSWQHSAVNCPKKEKSGNHGNK